MTIIARPHESVCRIRAKALNTLGNHFLYSRYNHFVFFRTDYSVITCMRIQREHRNTWCIDTKVFFQRTVEYRQFFHYRFLGNGICYLSDRKMSCHQSHSEIILQKDHQSLFVLTHTFFNILRMSWEMECFRLDVMLIDRSGHQYIYQTILIILQCSFQRIQSSLSCFWSRLGKFHFQFVFCTIQDIQLAILYTFCCTDDAEVGWNIHRLAMKSGHLRRTIHNRCTQFQHRSIRKGFQNNFVSYPIDISVGDTHSYFLSVFHERLNIIFYDYSAVAGACTFSSCTSGLMTISSICCSCGKLRV